MDVIQVMMDKHHYAKKPEGYEVGLIQNSLIATTLTVEQFANELTSGATVRPVVLVGGRSAECWQCQQVSRLCLLIGVFHLQLNMKSFDLCL